MQYKSTILLALLWLVAAARGAHAQQIPLAPNQSVTVRFDQVRLLEKGTPPVLFQNVSAQGNFSLDETGSVLTIRLQNTSLPAAGVALYALDIGLAHKLVNQTKMEATFSAFPDGGAWLGPTDKSALTAATGFSTFAARAAVLGRMEDLLIATSSLPAGFLQAGQGGVITLKLAVASAAIESPLRIEPRFYFLAPDPRTPLTKRMQLVVTGAARVNQ